MNWTFCDMPFESVSILPVGAVGQARCASSHSSIASRRATLRPPLAARRSSAAAGGRSSSCRGRALRAGSRRGRGPCAGVGCRRAPRSARVGQQDVHDHPQRRGLARAVGADEAVDGARRGRRARGRRRPWSPKVLVTPEISMASILVGHVRAFQRATSLDRSQQARGRGTTDCMSCAWKRSPYLAVRAL